MLSSSGFLVASMALVLLLGYAYLSRHLSKSGYSQSDPDDEEVTEDTAQEFFRNDVLSRN